MKIKKFRNFFTTLPIFCLPSSCRLSCVFPSYVLPSSFRISHQLLIFAASMLIHLLKSKIHRARVTQADLNYTGSITIDEDLMDAANLVANERVQVVNNNNGERLETYVIKGMRGSGVICLNGAAARKVQVGDILIIMSYAYMTAEEAKTHVPLSVHLEENSNKLTH